MVPEDKRLSRGYHTLMALRQSLAELTVDKPLSSITIDEICAHCGLTKGAFYHHYSSKDELLSQYAISDMSLYMAETIHSAQQAKPDDPVGQITLWIDALVRYVTDHRTSFKGYLFVGYPAELLSEFVADWRSAACEALTGWQQRGLIRSDLSAPVLLQYLDSFTYGISATCMSGYYPEAPDPQLVASFLRTLLPEAQEK